MQMHLTLPPMVNKMGSLLHEWSFKYW